MTLKARISFNLIIAFSIIIGCIMLVIYFSFANFRKEGFKNSLMSSSYITANYISKIPESDLVDVGSYISSHDNDKEDYLINEAIAVFNENRNLVYKNNVDFQNFISQKSFESVDSTDVFFVNLKDDEMLGIKRKINQHDYYIFTEAKDETGNDKLKFLGIILTLLFVFSLVIIAAFSYYFIRKQLKPLDEFKDQIKVITAKKLISGISEKNTDDEISVLIKSFNNLMKRLNVSFQSQKEFNASASHEMKTPLTRISFQIENLKKNIVDESSRKYLDSIQNEVYYLSDTLNSLLILTRIEDTPQEFLEEVRLDEVIFDAFANVKRNNDNLELDFQIKDQVEDGNLIITGVKSLLEIVFINLFKNAAIYSSQPKVLVEIEESYNDIEVKVSSIGEILTSEEEGRVFNAFSRGNNATNTVGSGLGLRISKRIMDFHSATIQYKSEGVDVNIISLFFKK